jgi:hypothetical protein
MCHLLLLAGALALLAATAGIAFGATGTVGPFTFASGVPGTTFECSIDNSAYKTCSSPYSPTLAAGAHTLRVQEKFTSTTTTTPTPPPSSSHCFSSPQPADIRPPHDQRGRTRGVFVSRLIGPRDRKLSRPDDQGPQHRRWSDNYRKQYDIDQRLHHHKRRVGLGRG